jgi:hypothetical protein
MNHEVESLTYFDVISDDKKMISDDSDNAKDNEALPIVVPFVP